jgi:MarR family transcriptional regulator, organic hydroperoxide resistance regulator
MRTVDHDPVFTRPSMSELLPSHVTETIQQETAPPALADFLCFAIYSANLAYGRAYKPILEQLGLTYPQYIAIVALWEKDHQTVGGLGEKMFLESNTLTPILKKLEVMGLVRRRRDPRDERQVVVSLTEQGRALRVKGLSMNLVKASGLESAQFKAVQKNVVALRDNLLRSTARL